MRLGTLGSRGGFGSAGSLGGVNRTYLQLSLLAASDAGVSNSDRITNVTTPSISVTPSLGGLIENDIITFSLDGVAQTPHTVTAAEELTGSVSLGFSALSLGVHTISASAVRGASSLGSGSISLTIDTTAPTLSSASGSATGTSTADLSVSSNEAGGILYYVVTLSSTTPTASQVMLGYDAFGIAASAHGYQDVLSPGSQPASASGLNASTFYYCHFVQMDTAGNISTVASSGSSFKTQSGPITYTARQIAVGADGFVAFINTGPARQADVFGPMIGEG